MTKSIKPKNLVLYADDDTDDLQLVQEAFAEYAKEVEVITFTDGIEALQWLQNLSEEEPTPCLIILDVNMPMLDGKQALMRLRKMERFEAVPVVLFTTSSLPADKAFAQKYGAGFITKPLNLKQMELITEEFIGHCVEEVRKNIRRSRS